MDKYEKRRLRLIEIRDSMCEGKGSEIARRIGRTSSYVTRMLWGKEKKGRKRIGDDMVDIIEEAFNLPSGWLDKKQPIGYISQKSSGTISTKGAKGMTVEPGPDIKGKVPLISYVQAGKWSEIIEFMPDDAIDWFPCPVCHSNKTFALRVRGESMYNPNKRPSFEEGDLIFVDPEKQPANGSLVVVRLEGENEATFKKLIIDSDKKYLSALNPAWPEQIIHLSNNARICGVVIFKGEII